MHFYVFLCISLYSDTLLRIFMYLLHITTYLHVFTTRYYLSSCIYYILLLIFMYLLHITTYLHVFTTHYFLSSYIYYTLLLIFMYLLHITIHTLFTQGSSGTTPSGSPSKAWLLSL